MRTPTSPLRSVRGGIEILVKVIPGSSRDRVLGVTGDHLRVAVTAHPEGGRANERLREILADHVGVPIRSVEILTGHGSPRKRVRIVGADPSLLARKCAEKK